MLSQAILKINEEKNKEKNNPYVQVVGDFLIDHLYQHPENAEKVINQDKSIMGSLKDMENKAQARKVGTCGMFSPQEGFEIVMKYYGIGPEAGTVPMNTTVPAASTKPAGINLNFDDDLY